MQFLPQLRFNFLVQCGNWWNVLLGFGKKIMSPYINRTTTFYAQSIRFGKTIGFGSIGNTNVNVTQTVPYGGMQSVTPVKNVFLDSVQVRFTLCSSNDRNEIVLQNGNI